MTAVSGEPFVGGLPPDRSGLGWQAAPQRSSLGVHSLIRTETLDPVLSRLTAVECSEATDELSRHATPVIRRT